MNRIDKKFKELKRNKKKAFIVFITAGDPDLATTKGLLFELERCGVDLVELGVPFSDPLADGLTIQRASERSLKKHTTLKKILRLVSEIRPKLKIPVALMSYYNPIFAYRVDKFIRDAKRCGVDGVIVPDLPPEEAGGLKRISKSEDFCPIFLVAPTSTKRRIKLISESSGGFVYYVSLMGVTGAREKLPQSLVKEIRRVKALTKKPVCVGFGISKPKQAREILKYADGIIVGSAIVNVIEKYKGRKGLVKRTGKFVEKLANATHKR